MKRAILRTTLALALAGPAAAWAWGPEGHTVVGDVAATLLTPTAKKQVRAILQDKNRRIGDYEVSCWADEIKGAKEYDQLYPDNGLWHFVDFDTFKRYDDDFELKPPADGQDVVDQIVRWQKALANKKASPAQRLDALRFLVHFVGDLHQPLHCAFRCGDMGGNMIPVNSFKGRKYSFGPNTPMDYPPSVHSVWDESMVLELMGGRSRTAFAKFLEEGLSPEQIQWWSQGTPLDWATDSYWRARKQVYRWTNGEHLPYTWSRPGMDLTSENYIDSRLPVAQEQLQKAGVRLALLLNEALDPKYVPPPKPEPKPEPKAEPAPAK